MDDKDQKKPTLNDFLDTPDSSLHTEADYKKEAERDNYGISKAFKDCLAKSAKYIVSLCYLCLAGLLIILLCLLGRYLFLIWGNEPSLGEAISKVMSYIGGLVSAVALNSFKKKKS